VYTTTLHPAAVLLSSNVLVFAILETFIVLSVSLLPCMYIISAFVALAILRYINALNNNNNNLGLYCVLFRRVLIYKIDVALQLTKLLLKKLLLLLVHSSLHIAHQTLAVYTDK